MRSFIIILLEICLLRQALSFPSLLAFQHEASSPFKKKPVAAAEFWQHQRRPDPHTSNIITNRPTTLFASPRDDDDDDDGDDDTKIAATVSTATIAVASTSIVTLICSSIVLWSEASILLSGCGPLQLNNAVERTPYWVVLIVASGCWFCRVAFGESLAAVYW
jgi:hypothetical protein